MFEFDCVDFRLLGLGLYEFNPGCREIIKGLERRLNQVAASVPGSPVLRPAYRAKGLASALASKEITIEQACRYVSNSMMVIMRVMELEVVYDK